MRLAGRDELLRDGGLSEGGRNSRAQQAEKNPKAGCDRTAGARAGRRCTDATPQPASLSVSLPHLSLPSLCSSLSLLSLSPRMTAKYDATFTWSVTRPSTQPARPSAPPRPQPPCPPAETLSPSLCCPNPSIQPARPSAAPHSVIVTGTFDAVRPVSPLARRMHTLPASLTPALTSLPSALVPPSVVRQHAPPRKGRRRLRGLGRARLGPDVRVQVWCVLSVPPPARRLALPSLAGWRSVVGQHTRARGIAMKLSSPDPWLARRRLPVPLPETPR